MSCILSRNTYFIGPSLYLSPLRPINICHVISAGGSDVESSDVLSSVDHLQQVSEQFSLKMLQFMSLFIFGLHFGLGADSWGQAWLREGVEGHWQRWFAVTVLFPHCKCFVMLSSQEVRRTPRRPALPQLIDLVKENGNGIDSVRPQMAMCQPHLDNNSSITWRYCRPCFDTPIRCNDCADFMICTICTTSTARRWVSYGVGAGCTGGMNIAYAANFIVIYTIYCMLNPADLEPVCRLLCSGGYHV